MSTPTTFLRRGPWDLPDGPHVQGHRGARGEVVESTIAGFLHAGRVGCGGIELDVLLSADGVPVVWHDPVLEPGRCLAPDELMGRRVDELTAAELALVDIGRVPDPRHPDALLVRDERIRPLTEVFQIVRDRYPDLWWTLEVKVDVQDARDVARRRGLVEATIEAVHRTGSQGRTVIHSFDWAVLDVAREVDDRLPRSALIQMGHTDLPGSSWTGSVDLADHPADIAAAAAAAGAHMIAPGVLAVGTVGAEAYRDDDSSPSPVTPDLVDRAHELGLAVVPRTVNRCADLRSLIAAGVDGLVTDYPRRALDIIRNG